jgi:hypothetical protein
VSRLLWQWAHPAGDAPAHTDAAADTDAASDSADPAA